MSQSKLIERATFPLMVALQAMPILTLVPMIAIIFGSNQTSRVIVCVLITIFPIVLNTLFGLVSGDPGLHDLITLHRGGRVTRLRKVMFPSALPAMFAGLRISAGLSVIGAIVGDFFFGKGEKGLGQLIRQYASNSNDIPVMYATTSWRRRWASSCSCCSARSSTPSSAPGTTRNPAAAARPHLHDRRPRQSAECQAPLEGDCRSDRAADAASVQSELIHGGPPISICYLLTQYRRKPQL